MDMDWAGLGFFFGEMGAQYFGNFNIYKYRRIYFFWMKEIAYLCFF